jgi:hypothetical protein
VTHHVLDSKNHRPAQGSERPAPLPEVWRNEELEAVHHAENLPGLHAGMVSVLPLVSDVSHRKGGLRPVNRNGQNNQYNGHKPLSAREQEVFDLLVQSEKK